MEVRWSGIEREPLRFLKLFLAHEAEVRALIGSLRRLASGVAERDADWGTWQMALSKGYDDYDPGATVRCLGTRRRASNRTLVQHQHDARQPDQLLRRRQIEAVRDAFNRSDVAAGSGRREEALRGSAFALYRSARRKYFDCDTAAAPRPRQIASQLHISVDAVYQTLSRLRTQLAECVRRRITSNQVLRG